jgi:hypothetical protein
MISDQLVLLVYLQSYSPKLCRDGSSLVSMNWSAPTKQQYFIKKCSIQDSFVFVKGQAKKSRQSKTQALLLKA